MEDGVENPAPQEGMLQRNSLEEFHSVFANFEKHLDELGRRIEELTEENMAMKMGQRQLEENRARQLVAQNETEILRIQTIENSREVIRKLKIVLDSAYTVCNALRRINIHFLPFPGNDYSIAPGYLDPHFREINEERDRFRDNVDQLNLAVLNSSHTHTGLYNSCCEYIRELRNFMNCDNILGLLEFLPKAIEETKVDDIIQFKSMVNHLCIQFTALEEKHHEGLKQLIITYITSQMVIPAMNQIADQNDNDNNMIE